MSSEIQRLRMEVGRERMAFFEALRAYEHAKAEADRAWAVVKEHEQRLIDAGAKAADAIVREGK